MSLFDLQDVCIAIGSIATLDLPMVVDLIGIYVRKDRTAAEQTRATDMEAALLHLRHLLPTKRTHSLNSKLRPFFVLRCSSSASPPSFSSPAIPGGRGRRQSSSASPISTSDRDAIRSIRIKKMQELRSIGLNPYAYKWDRTHTANQLQEIYRDLGNGKESTVENDHVSVAGRIVARRAFGKLTFLTLRDDSGTIQCTSISYRRYFSSTALSTSSQIAYYIRLGEIETAREMFDQMPRKNIASWNTIISGYFRHNQPIEAQRLFDQMPERNTVSWNGLISGYIKNSMVKKAREIFNVMPDRNVISWTAMVKGYIEAGMVSEAEALFWQMPERNVVSWTVMLGGLMNDGRIGDARRFYHMMPVKDVVAKTSMIGGLCSEGQLYEARELFDCMRQRNVVSWTAMISGYLDSGKVDIARKLFEVMPERNEVTWTAMLMGYTNCGRIEDAWELFKAMPSKSVVACNALIIGLGKTGDISKARKVFDLTREKDDGTWTAMIKIYERKAFELEALCLFRMMQSKGVRLHFPSLISILSVCSSLAILNHGKQVHAKLLRSQLDDDVYLMSVLITMYMKCGDLFSAKIVFDRFECKDTVMWNSMITGYSQHGLGTEALQVFMEMLSLGITPDNVTLIGVLSACSYSGKVKEGKEIFKSMKSKYGIEATTEHYACMVDLLGRAGQLEEAKDLINDMSVFADAIIWGSLMGACRNHMNSDLAEVAAKKLLLLEPYNAGPYVLLSNIYALKGRWADVAKLRKTMTSRKVTKLPGFSWIEVEKEVHMFTGGASKPHTELKEIVKMLEKLGGMLRESGYNPDGSFALHDVDDEEKAQSLRHHSEKLAVAYGLLKLPAGIPIRVMKNLRVCGDCHTAIKLIANLTGREIILRDLNRFHHFKDGSCSCHDYW
ncbi:pentatricopeptide repeat-containing protein mitochondrial-like [Dorcoceras hygrometricum]|uniref:Pentatricopeptide repeat-containing protein mitochondrial-like n=1 Tax=Dorcoceras hygrometricum TaxID=472368 RepID=A0A2Z7CH68_9LAMI|nr:pentatricopeptide repeat-containing protein mitochondrial-like [Dorcoceras hygrometricum]